MAGPEVVAAQQMTRGASHTMVHQAERSPAETVRAASIVWTAAALPGKQLDSCQGGALFTYVVVRCLSVDSLPDMRPNTIVRSGVLAYMRTLRPGGPSTDGTGRFVSSGCSAGRDVNCGKRLARPCHAKGPWYSLARRRNEPGQARRRLAVTWKRPLSRRRQTVAVRGGYGL